MPIRTELEEVRATGQIIERFQRVAPVDVMGMAEAFGLAVWEDDINPYAGKITRDEVHGGSSGYSVIVNAQDPWIQQRFTIAHEIAHFILHAEELKNRDFLDPLYRGGTANALETEADKLAADILMPLSLIESLVNGGVTSIEGLADALQVSTTTMQVRLGASFVR